MKKGKKALMDSMGYFNEYDKVIIQNLFRIDPLGHESRMVFTNESFETTNVMNFVLLPSIKGKRKKINKEKMH